MLLAVAGTLAASGGCSEPAAPTAPPEPQGPAPVRIELEPWSGIMAAGESVYVTAQVIYADGSRKLAESVEWSVEGPFLNTGTPSAPHPSRSPWLRATGDGRAWVHARVDTVRGSGVFTVATPLPRVEYSPIHVGDTTWAGAQYRVIGNWGGGLDTSYHHFPTRGLGVSPAGILRVIGDQGVVGVAPGRATVSVFAGLDTLLAEIDVLEPGTEFVALSELGRSNETPCGLSVTRDTILCWGSSRRSDPVVQWSPGPPLRIPTGEPLSRLSSWDGFLCGLTQSGTLRCFREAVPNLMPDTSHRWIDFQVTSRYFNPSGCGVLTDSTLACVIGQTVHRIADTLRVTSMDADDGQLCAITVDSLPLCWPARFLPNTAPRSFPTIPKALGISTRYGRTCVLDANRVGWCTRDGDFLPPFDLGTGSLETYPYTLYRLSSPPLAAVDVRSPIHALTMTGDVYSIDATFAGRPVEGATSAVAFTTIGFGTRCMLRADRSVWCWGVNTGDGTAIGRQTPRRVRAIP